MAQEQGLNADQPAAGEDVSRRNLIALIGAVVGGSALVRCADAGSAGDGPAIEQGAQNLVMLDGGVPVVDYSRLEDAAAAHSGGAPVTLIVDKPLLITDTSVEIPANMTLRFRDAGQLVVPPNKTVTLSGPIEAPSSPNHPLFKVGGFGVDGGVGVGGKVIPNHPGTTYYANWWSDDHGNAGGYGEPNEADIGRQWNNMVRGLSPQQKNGAVASARRFAVAGHRRLSTMMDIRGLQAEQHLDFSGALLRVDMPAGIAVNFTNSMHLRVTRLVLRSVNVSSTIGAHVGVLLARPAGGTNEGANTFEDLRILGSWRVAGLYNAASPGNVFIAGVIENFNPSTAIGRYAAFFGRRVRPDDTGMLLPEYGTPAPQTSVQNGTLPGQVLLATRLRGNVSQATLYIAGFSNFVARSPYTHTINAASHVTIDATDAPTGGVQIDHIYGEGAPVSGLLIKSDDDANRIATVNFSTRGFEATTNAVSIQTKHVDTSFFRLRGGLPFVCRSDLWLRDTQIEVADDATPITLGDVFTGRIMMGNVTLLNIGVPVTLDAEISCFGTTTPRTELTIPLAFKAGFPGPVHPTENPTGHPSLIANGEAILYMNPQNGNIVAKIGTSSGPIDTVLANWQSGQVVSGECT